MGSPNEKLQKQPCGNLPAAAEHAERAVARAARSATAWRALAQVRCGQVRLVDAEQAPHKALDLDPVSTGKSHRQLGWIYVTQRRHDEAIAAFSSDLPWSTLAQCLAAGIPVLGSTDPLLVDTVTDAGWTLPITDPIENWLDILDRVMLGSLSHAAVAQRAMRQAAGLRLTQQEAAAQSVKMTVQHLADCGRLVSGWV